ncbi:S8 family serine peptidase [Rhodanobacter sp. L36]|uniref:S8 family serine peptidase n=1 Tax=Rhodanobacter sp. L36 TaxID=1747221 RepID=UPI00131B3A83|nr:S8 family serine peptidase [Rhodanobacter sp. L36]
MLKLSVAIGVALTVLTVSNAANGQAKKEVRSIDDLPQFSYAVKGTVADILKSSPQAFEATVAPMRADIDRVLNDYDIHDTATLRGLLQAKLGAQIASGKEDKAALATIEQLRSHEEKPDARLITGLAPQAFLEARMADGTTPGTCPKSFQANYAKKLNALPWATVGVAETRLKGLAQVANATFMTGLAERDIAPTLDRSHTLSSLLAWKLMAARTNMDVVVTCRTEIATATNRYVDQHAVQKPDIWAARDVTLPPDAKLTPVPVAIWDSGFDASLFPGQLLLGTNKQPVMGPTYDIDYRPSHEPLAPLSAQDKASYPKVVAAANGVSDLQTGIDSPAAAAFRQQAATMSPAQMKDFMQTFDSSESYMHGTHVAGIAARGNPAIRLINARITYDTRPVPAPPTDDLQKRNAAAYRDTVAWFRAHHVRVVNMSWWNRPSNYEDDLERNGIGKTAEERKTLARHYFSIERDGLYAALKGAPDVLFVTIAGNNDSDNAFEETIPSSFKLPNLLVVGAVDQAGQRTNFTSTGQNIGVYADGYQVESVVPGGAKVRMSGTSMAAPEVTNLAAKILAVNPKLTPEQVIDIITRTSDAGESPTIRRINPKAALSSVMVHDDRANTTH